MNGRCVITNSVSNCKSRGNRYLQGLSCILAKETRRSSEQVVKVNESRFSEHLGWYLFTRSCFAGSEGEREIHSLLPSGKNRGSAKSGNATRPEFRSSCRTSGETERANTSFRVIKCEREKSRSESEQKKVSRV